MNTRTVRGLEGCVVLGARDFVRTSDCFLVSVSNTCFWIHCINQGSADIRGRERWEIGLSPELGPSWKVDAVWSFFQLFFFDFQSHCDLDKLLCRYPQKKAHSRKRSDSTPGGVKFPAVLVESLPKNSAQAAMDECAISNIPRPVEAPSMNPGWISNPAFLRVGG